MASNGSILAMRHQVSNVRATGGACENLAMRFLLLASLVFAACGGDDGADSIGVGAQCTSNDECNQDDGMQTCLAFNGGYCGLQGCMHDSDCPSASACIMHTDGINYCFRTCVDKPDCNANRDVENEANCSANVTFVDGANNRQACVPPS
jgi:hypothetical protein